VVRLSALPFCNRKLVDIPYDPELGVTIPPLFELMVYVDPSRTPVGFRLKEM